MSSEIVDGSVSGGTTTSNTIIFPGLRALLDHVPPSGRFEDYETAVLDDNILGKGTENSRKRTLRSLRELYLLRPETTLFRALRDLWSDDISAQPLLAGLSAIARDAVFRASAAAIVGSSVGEVMTSNELAVEVEAQFPDNYSERSLAKIGRNAFASWEQTGHLDSGEQTGKTRVRAVCRPANVAYALLLGNLEGMRGQALFETTWAKVLDQPKSHLMDLAFGASQRGLIEFRSAGGVVEVGFRELLRPFDQEQGSLL